MKLVVPFWFASSSIKIYVVNKGSCVLSTSISHDGKGLTDENYQIV